MQHVAAGFDADDVAAAIDRSQVIDEIAIMLAAIGKRIENGRVALDFVELLEFVVAVCVDHEEIVAAPLEVKGDSDRGLGQNKIGFVLILPPDEKTAVCSLVPALAPHLR